MSYERWLNCDHEYIVHGAAAQCSKCNDICSRYNIPKNAKSQLAPPREKTKYQLEEEERKAMTRAYYWVKLAVLREQLEPCKSYGEAYCLAQYLPEGYGASW